MTPIRSPATSAGYRGLNQGFYQLLRAYPHLQRADDHLYVDAILFAKTMQAQDPQVQKAYLGTH
jgi:hypothetical protein